MEKATAEDVADAKITYMNVSMSTSIGCMDLKKRTTTIRPELRGSVQGIVKNTNKYLLLPLLGSG